MIGERPKDYLIALQNMSNTHDVTYLAEPVLSNPKFPLWTGSSKPHQHHYGKGLLMVHTWEVAVIAQTVNRELGYNVDRQKLERMIDTCLLTEAELKKGNRFWMNFNDPFPSWTETN